MGGFFLSVRIYCLMITSKNKTNLKKQLIYVTEFENFYLHLR